MDVKHIPPAFIPAKSELTATVQSLTRSQFFLDYNFQYTNVSNFVVWYKTNFATLTKEEIATLQAKIMKLPTMPMEIILTKLLRQLMKIIHFLCPPN